jgi:hypothetical protein
VDDLLKNFPFPTKRESQSGVSNQIGTAFDSGYKYIVLEAATGFGKSPVAIATARTLGTSLRKINEKFHWKFKPTVIWSGNGYHIYLPVQLSGPSWCLAHTDVFHGLSSDPDRRFMQWAEQYLSDGKSDPVHSKTVSFKNCMLRIPGSINSKNGEQVRILQKWDGQRPYINWILKDFQRYLIQKKIGGHKQREEQEISCYFSTDWSKRKVLKQS